MVFMVFKFAKFKFSFDLGKLKRSDLGTPSRQMPQFGSKWCSNSNKQNDLSMFIGIFNPLGDLQNPLYDPQYDLLVDMIVHSLCICKSIHLAFEVFGEGTSEVASEGTFEKTPEETEKAFGKRN